MSTEELKLQIFRQVDALEDSKLRELYCIMLNYINGTKEITEWVGGVSEIENQGIEEAIKEMNDGKGISHKEVMDKMTSKYRHA